MMHFEGNPLGPVVGLLLLAVVVGWFVLLSRLFKRLRLNHIEKYRQMGEPALLFQTNIATVIATSRFLFSREYRQLGDRTLSKLSRQMLVYLAAMLTLFVTVALFMNRLQWRMYAA